MTRVIAAGVAVIDFVFRLDEVPEPGQKYRAREAMIVGGGCAANAAVTISRLGGEAVLAARTGDDMIGDMVVSGLEEERVDCSLVKRHRGKRTSYSSVVIDAHGERNIVAFRDEAMDFGAEWLVRDMPDEFDAALADTRWPEGAHALMEGARQRGVPGIIDGEAPVREAPEALKSASHIAFSAQGLLDYCGHEDFEAGLRQAADETDAWVCVTNGADGAYWWDGEKVRHVPTFTVETVDTLGAGDVWHGAFALMLAKGMQEPEAIRYANAVSAIKCTQFGGRTGIPSGQTVNDFLKENPSCT
ncbi:MAG: PfkB family carbohydrate kinase [Alphaproteobacteria bacterium]|nr:PfkB family carbohydrate kinase [Alphaproteobacteria bacterium]